MDVNCSYQNPLEKGTAHKSYSKRNDSPEGTSIEKNPHLNTGYLSIQPGGRSRYIGSNFWASADLEGLEIDSLCLDLPLFLPNSSYGVVNHYPGRLGSPNSMSSQNSWHDLGTILLILPQKNICDELYGNFIASTHPLIPLLHLPSFDQQYIHFWEWYQKWNHADIPEGVLAETPGFLSLMASVLFAGSLVGPAYEFSMAMNPLQLSNLQSNLYQLTAQSLSLVRFPQSPSIYSLQAFLVCRSLQIREEEALSPCSFVAMAFRIAQVMGLHRDGTEFSLGPIEVELRRRLWWYIIHLDVMSSFISGLPLVASLEASTTTMPSEFEDELIGNADNNVRENSSLSTSYVLTVGRYEASSVIREILQTISLPQRYNATQLGNFIKTIKQLSTSIEARISKLLQMKCNDNFKSWSINLLRLTVDQAYCLVYFPLLRDESIWIRFRAEWVIPSFFLSKAKILQGRSLIFSQCCGYLFKCPQINLISHINGYILETTNRFSLSLCC
jgi:Fungal specific transcription factor domain